MGWLRIDDGFTEHRKLLELQRSQRWTWLEVMGYVARQNNGAQVPAGITDVFQYITPTFLERCEEVELLDRSPGGVYLIHDWEKYNPKDPSHADRQHRYRKRKRDGESDGKSDGGVTDE